jgi:alpha-mannosidase
LLIKFRQTIINVIVYIVTGLLVTASAQLPAATKSYVDTIDPESIDLTQPTLFIVPYSHLDDVWRWSYPQVIRDFFKHTLDDNFAAFKQYPHFVFNWSGASRYAMMREYYPERYQELKQWVAAGRWFPSGSSWVENDTNVPSTESIIRQILFGREYFMKEFGKESFEYMLPDCFGFPYSLPSVLNHCGIRGFSTQKLTWNSANGIPFNVGRWIGPDGNWVIAALNAGNYAAAHEVVYSRDEETLKRLENNRKRSGLPIDFYYLGGGDRNNADRGGMPQKVSLEYLEKSYYEEGPVKVVSGPADLMVRAITDEQAKKFPTWNRDLLLIEHSTGVLTSQAYVKKLNRDGELLAHASECAAVTAAISTGAAYPVEALNQAWGLLLRNQFHDTLPGTSIPKAYEYVWNDGIIALNLFAGVFKDAVGTLAQSLNTDVHGTPVLVFNPLSIPRKDNVEAFIPDELSEAESIAVFDAQGNEMPSQVVVGYDGKSRILFQTDLPPVGGAVYSIRQAESKIKNSELVVRNDYLENKNFRVKIDTNGDISSIFDKRIEKELLEQPIQLEFGENFPDIKPAWRIYWKDISKPARSVAADPVSIKIIEAGPVRAAIEVVRENEGSKIIQRIRLSAGTDGSRVEIANLIDWKSRGALLKAAFHLTASAPEATYNLDLGTIKRGNRNEKQYEVPHHAWFDLTDISGEYGVSILTGSKYGSDKVNDNTIRLTLIHGPDTKDSKQEVLDDGSMSEQRWQDWGRHQFSYAITGHKGDWRQGKSHWEAMRFEQRLAAFSVPKHKGTGSSFSLINMDNDQVNIQAVKMAEDGSGLVIRLQELHGKVCSGAVLSAIKPILAAEELDGTERPLNIPLATNKGKLSIDFMPYELKTILLKIEHTKALPMATQPIEMEYDTDIFSYNSNREDGYREDGFAVRRPRSEGHRGTFDGKGGTYPAEMIGDMVQLGNVLFNIGSREERVFNSVACLGQRINLPKETTVIHILAAADVDTDVTFKAGKKELPLTIGGWSDYMGLWDNREFDGFVAELSYSLRNDLKTIHPAFIRDHRIAWSVSHRHLPAGDALYEYGYLFAYRLEIPEGTTSITLPDSRFVRIVAMSVGDEGHATALQSPFEDLHRDSSFNERFTAPLPDKNPEFTDKFVQKE